MTRAALLLAGATLLVTPVAGPVVPFAVATIRFERNATDGDFETVVEAKGGDEGLVKLAVVSPDGSTVIDITAPVATTLGVRQLLFESPEPRDLASLQAAYPEGAYTFTGTTAGGERFEGTARLSHALPAAVSFLRPASGARGVRATGLEVSWTPVKDLAGYIVSIEQLDADVSLTVRLPASVSRFAVPDGFLQPGTSYQLGIGTVAGGGNISFVETTFTTAEKE